MDTLAFVGSKQWLRFLGALEIEPSNAGVNADLRAAIPHAFTAEAKAKLRADPANAELLQVPGAEEALAEPAKHLHDPVFKQILAALAKATDKAG